MNSKFLLLSLSIFVFIAATVLFLRSPSEPQTISCLESSITQQFQQQWDAKKAPEDTRKIQKVALGKFYIPDGNTRSYAELIVTWSNVGNTVSVPVVQVGGAAVLSYEVPESHQILNAYISCK